MYHSVQMKIQLKYEYILLKFTPPPFMVFLINDIEVFPIKCTLVYKWIIQMKIKFEF